ncbi:MAG: Fic family protein [Planctomycetaceae bacterium]
MAYSPQFTITTTLLGYVESIASTRERIAQAAVAVPWMHAIQRDSRSRNAYASTAIEGNSLSLEQVRAIEAGGSPLAASNRERREIENCLAGLRHIERQPARDRLRHDDILELHRILADGVMEQGVAGRYRTIAVRVGSFVPPPPSDVSGLMFELLSWWNDKAEVVSPVLSSAIIHYRFEAIHPFADGNGRTGRALSLWELYRRGFDSHHVFSVDEFFWEDRERYYRMLMDVRERGEDLTAWLEYCAEGLLVTLERVWSRIQAVDRRAAGPPLMLTPRQEQVLRLLRDHGGMAPAEMWARLGVSKQAASGILRPLLDAGVILRTGTRKTGRYVLP